MMSFRSSGEISRKRWSFPLVTAILLSSCAPALGQVSPPGQAGSIQEDRGTIQVTGQAQISVPADRAHITFSVETEGSTAGEATSANASLMEQVISAIRGMNLPGADLETFGYALMPEYQISREGTGTRSISGYRVQNTLRVTLPEVTSVGPVLDRAVEAGANRVASLQFDASDTRAAQTQALRQAVNQAREQAETIAAAMGVRLGMALEVQGGANAPLPQPMGGVMFRAAAEAVTPVEAGDQTVTASVTIQYRILEGGR